MTKQELAARLDAFEAALAAYGVSKFTAKEIWALRAEIAEEIRTVEFSDPGERKDLWQRLQDGIDMLKQKSALLQVENEAFATEAEERIDALQRPVDEAPPEKEWTREELAALRALGSDLFDFLRQNRWPGAERRKAVWDRFNAARDRIKALEDALFARVRAAIEERKASSAAVAVPFRSALEACRPAADPAALLPALDVVAALLPRADGARFAEIRSAFDSGAAAKAPLKMKSDSLREFRRLFTEERARFSKEDGQETYALLSAVQKEIDAAWEAYKGERQKKQDEWKEKQQAFATMLTEKLAKRRADKANLEKVISAKVDFGPKLEQRLVNQQDYLNKLYDDLDELKAKHETARSFDMRERMEAAIESKQARIAEVEADMKSVQQRIDANAKDISEIRGKVQKIEEGIAEMEAKIADVQRKEKDRG